MPTLTIDNRKIEVAEGTTLLDASRQAGVHVPSLCYLKDVQAMGSCRVCIVEVEGAKTLVASCVTPAAEGMKVHTNTPKVREARRTVVELILTDHEGDCQTCDRNGDCELQAVARDLGIREIAWTGAKSKRMTDASTPALVRDTAKCILCRRCVTVCSQTQGVAAIFPQRRGFQSVIGPAFASNLSDVVCVQCGQCAAVCPVGRHRRARPDRGGVGGARRPEEDRGGADGPGHPGGPRGVLRLPGRHPRDGKDGDRPAPARVRPGVRHELHGRPHDHGGGHGAADPAEEGPRGQDAGRRCPCSRAARRAGSGSPSTSTPRSSPTSRPASRRSRCSARWPRPTSPRRSARGPRTSSSSR